MKNTIETGSIVITDRGTETKNRHNERRQIMRSGGAILLAAVSAAIGGNVQASDCDRSLGEEKKNPDQAGSDSDTGTSADRNGCGRKGKSPKMTSTHSNTIKSRPAIPVVKVKA